MISGLNYLFIFFWDKQAATDGHFGSIVVQGISSVLLRRSIIMKLTVCLSKEFSLHLKSLV